MLTEVGDFVTAKHPYLLELRQRAAELTAQLHGDGGPGEGPSRALDGRGTPRLGAGDLAESSDLDPIGEGGGGGSSSRLHSARSFTSEETEEDISRGVAQIFMHIMAGDVAQIKLFLKRGGRADTTYQSAHGWDVGPDCMRSRIERALRVRCFAPRARLSCVSGRAY